MLQFRAWRDAVSYCVSAASGKVTKRDFGESQGLFKKAEKTIQQNKLTQREVDETEDKD